MPVRETGILYFERFPAYTVASKSIPRGYTTRKCSVSSCDHLTLAGLSPGVLNCACALKGSTSRARHSARRKLRSISVSFFINANISQFFEIFLVFL